MHYRINSKNNVFWVLIISVKPKATKCAIKSTKKMKLVNIARITSTSSPELLVVPDVT